MTSEKYQFNGDRQYLKEYVKEHYEGTDNEEFWELNTDIKNVVANRIKCIEKMIEENYKVGCTAANAIGL